MTPRAMAQAPAHFHRFLTYCVAVARENAHVDVKISIPEEFAQTYYRHVLFVRTEDTWRVLCHISGLPHQMLSDEIRGLLDDRKNCGAASERVLPDLDRSMYKSWLSRFHRFCFYY